MATLIWFTFFASDIAGCGAPEIGKYNDTKIVTGLTLHYECPSCFQQFHVN